jgi:hypothetical protein
METIFVHIIFLSAFRKIQQRYCNNQIEQGHQTMLLQGMAKFWLDDFVQVIGRGIYQTGKDSIAASWKALFKSDSQIAYIRNPEEITISDNDTLAWERGEWIGIHSYSKGGNYAAMWIKRNGNWMLKAELFVSLKANKQQY